MSCKVIAIARDGKQRLRMVTHRGGSLRLATIFAGNLRALLHFAGVQSIVVEVEQNITKRKDSMPLYVRPCPDIEPEDVGAED